MRKLFAYQTVQKALIEYYDSYGTYASVAELLPSISEYTLIGEEEPVPRPVFYDWDLEDPCQLKELYNHSYLDFYRVNTDVEYWIKAFLSA